MMKILNSTTRTKRRGDDFLPAKTNMRRWDYGTQQAWNS